MKETTKWAKVFSIFLLLSLVILNTSSVQGKSVQGKKKGGNGKGTKTAMHAIAKWVGCPFPIFQFMPLFSGDTTDTELCPEAGAIISSKGRGGFFTHFRRGCFNWLTLSSGIEIEKGEFSAYQDKDTGEVVAIQVWLYDFENNVYKTEKIWLDPQSEPPNPDGFRITVCQHNLPVYTHRQWKKRNFVGEISVGVIDYEPK